MGILYHYPVNTQRRNYVGLTSLRLRQNDVNSTCVFDG